MRTSLLAFLVFLSTTVANAAIVRERHRAIAQRANDILGVSPPRDNQDTTLRPRLLSPLNSQRRASGDLPVHAPRRHRRRHAHV